MKMFFHKAYDVCCCQIVSLLIALLMRWKKKIEFFFVSSYFGMKIDEKQPKNCTKIV